MNSAEKGIMGMLHRQAILARSKEIFIHELQIQDPSIDIIEAIRYSLHSMPPPPIAGGCISKWPGVEKGRALIDKNVDFLWCLL